VAAFRLTLPDVALVMSTREPPELRDGLIAFGITHTSAGSHTEPGGYTHPNEAQEQFEVADHRPASEVADALRAMGYEPVWKDWDPAMRLAASR
jgi:2-iminoacetate synthase